MNKLLLVFFAVWLSACSTYWTNPNNPNANFQVDDAICTNEARRAMPDQQNNLPSSSSTNCTGGYGAVNCNTTYNNSGANMGSGIATGMQRDSYIENCLNAKGWHKTTKASADKAATERQVLINEARTKGPAENSKISEEGRAVCDDPEFRPVYIKSPCGIKTLEHFADKSKVTQEQKVVLLKLTKIWSSLNERRIANWRKYGNDNLKKFADYFYQWQIVEGDKADLALYEGRVTWGQYNQKNREISTNLQTEWKRLGL